MVFLQTLEVPSQEWVSGCKDLQPSSSQSCYLRPTSQTPAESPHHIPGNDYRYPRAPATSWSLGRSFFSHEAHREAARTAGGQFGLKSDCFTQSHPIRTGEPRCCCTFYKTAPICCHEIQPDLGTS